jgi:RimJ/RimL family protein N-acetyltransferase
MPDPERVMADPESLNGAGFPGAHHRSDPPSSHLDAGGSEPLFPDLTRDDVFRLETPRLWLRWPRHSDAAALGAFAGLKPVAEMTGSWPHPLPEGEAERRIFEARKANATGTRLILALTPRARPNHQIGTIGIGPGSGPGAGPEIEIGYMLHPDHWGQGLMIEAVQAVLNTVFGYTPTPAVTAWTRVVNPASRRLLEKCGFRHNGSALRDLPARGGMLPCDAFVLDRKTWAALVSWRQSAPVPAGQPAGEPPQVSQAQASGSLDLRSGLPAGGILPGDGALTCA